MANCRNCGAPHNNQRCGYCGTWYNKEHIVSPRKLGLSETVPEPTIELNDESKSINWIVVFLLAIPFIWIFHKYFKRKL